MKLFTKKIVCRGCKGTLRDSFDGGSCLSCHNTGCEELSLWEIGKYNRLIAKYGKEEDKIVRIT